MSKPHFITPLRMEALCGPDGLPLCNRDGRRLYVLLAALVYWSEVTCSLIVAPSRYVTDLGSVPRIPVVFDALGEIAQEPYVIHDLMYSKHTFPRETADQVLLEGLEAVGVPLLKRRAIYLGVRIGGGSHYGDA